jgi:hypothetical protein
VEEGDLDQLWLQVIASWDDAAVHDTFVLRCRAEKQLGIAAARYREVIQRSTAYREDGNRAETAAKRLQSLTALALGDLEALRSDPAPHRPIVRLFARVVLIAMALTAIGFAALAALSR